MVVAGWGLLPQIAQKIQSQWRDIGIELELKQVPSFTALIANPTSHADPAKRQAMLQLKVLLDGVLEARGKVLVKLNVAGDRLADVIRLVPSMKAPTVSELFGQGGYAVETVVAKSVINTLIPALKDAGATDIIELPLAKIVH